MVQRRFTRRRGARGFTLIEMLVALAVTLIMMGAVVTLFGVITESVSGSRSAIEMSDRLRAARNQLQNDLQGVTATMQPPLRPDNDEGYFEILEGTRYDASYLDQSNTFNKGKAQFGDIDDALMFTTRARKAPFAGKFNGVVIESPTAEVAYFLVQNGPAIDVLSQTVPIRLCTLYRRVLIVSPKVGDIAAGNFTDEFYDDNDISVSYVDPDGAIGPLPGFLRPNTLGDLTKRENRFAHYGTPGAGNPGYGVFPFGVDPWAMAPNIFVPPVAVTKPANFPAAPRPFESAFLSPMEHARLGDDVLLTNVLAFDVQVYDPGAPVYVSNNVAVEPRDPGYRNLLSNGTPAAFGAYADLGYGALPAPSYTPPPGAPLPLFNGAPNAKSGMTPRPFVYDTWSLHYEHDGLAQENGTNIDLGTNGLDDNTNGIVDDIGEYDTLPPYPSPLRGVKVTIRVYEPDSQQVREAVIIQDFLPD